MKNLDIVPLFDLYGGILTPKQRDFLDYYYNDDLSLAEISENEGITRQGVRDAIKNAEKKLLETEQALGLYSRIGELNSALAKCMDAAQRISRYNDENLNDDFIETAAIEIKAAAAMSGDE